MRAEIIVQESKGITQKERAGRKLTKEQKEKIALAEDILKMVTATICRKNFFLQPFLQIFKWVPVEEDILLETDGIHLFYQPERLLQMLGDRQLCEVEKALLHILGHGLLGHFELRSQLGGGEEADISMDYEAHRLGENLGWWREKSKKSYFPVQTFSLQTSFSVPDVPETLNSMGAHEIYYGMKSQPGLADFFEKWKKYYPKKDDHQVWDRNEKKHYFIELTEDGKGEAGEDVNEDGKNVWKEMLGQVFGGFQMSFQKLQLVLEEGEGRQGKASGGEEYCISAAKENHRSYRDVLSRFFREQESFSEKADTIDKVLYTYSRDLYGDVVLVEPEEYSESKKLGTVAIAIDTSGSCAGEVAELFLRETKNMFRDLSGDISFEQVLLFQCDTEIRMEKIYKTPEELPKGDDFQFYGFGGTDFVPVFDRLEELKKKKGINVDCLLYLTDGYGNFPDKKPEYPTFFILTEKGVRIPEWAKEVYLNNRE